MQCSTEHVICSSLLKSEGKNSLCKNSSNLTFEPVYDYRVSSGAWHCHAHWLSSPAPDKPKDDLDLVVELTVIFLYTSLPCGITGWLTNTIYIELLLAFVWVGNWPPIFGMIHLWLAYLKGSYCWWDLIKPVEQCKCWVRSVLIAKWERVIQVICTGCNDRLVSCQHLQLPTWFVQSSCSHRLWWGLYVMMYSSFPPPCFRNESK